MGCISFAKKFARANNQLAMESTPPSAGRMLCVCYTIQLPIPNNDMVQLMSVTRC